MAHRVILHVDMDAFYASIEQRDRPELRGRPVIVGGNSRRGVVATASYEARPFGVHSAMPMARAVRLCPEATVLPPRMAHYGEVSRQIMAVLSDFSPAVEPLSLDEAFLDMTGSAHLFGPPPEMAAKIKAKIKATTALTCSIGVAPNKFLAKLATELDKPDGVTVIEPGRERGTIAPLPIRRLWGVGPKAAERLTALGLTTIGHVAAADPHWLRRRLGPSLADHIHALANGVDDRPVVSDREALSVGSEVTLEHDVQGKDQIVPILRAQCERVAAHLRRKHLKAGSVRLKLRYSQTFQLTTRDGPLPMPADDSLTLLTAATHLLDRLDVDQPIRLVGAAGFDLIEADAPAQIDLFAQEGSEKQGKLERTMDEIRARFGDKIRRGG